MATEDRILRALLRLNVDAAAADRAAAEVRDVREEVKRLGEEFDEAGKKSGRLGGIGRAVQFGKLTDDTKDRLEFLGDGFEQLNDTLEELGIQSKWVSSEALRAAGSLSRINSDPIGAAVNAIGMAAKTFQDFTDKIEDGTQRVEDSWSTFFDQRQGMDALEFARSYNDAQARVNAAYEKGGFRAELFVDRADSVNASLAKLNEFLVTGATSYENYVDGVGELNSNLGEGEQAIGLLSREQFENQRRVYELSAAYREGNITITELAAAYSEAVGEMGVFGVKFGDMIEGIAEGVEKAEEAARRTEVWPQAVDAYIRFQEEVGASQDKWLADRMGAQDEYNQNVAEAEAELGEQRQAIIDDYDGQILRLEEDLQRNLVEIDERAVEERLSLTQRYLADVRASETDYYRRRQELADSFGIQAARAEQDHQIRIQRMREDAQQRENDAVAARDALALIRAHRDYDRDRSRADEDFNLQQQRRSEDYARQLDQMKENFERQQAERQADYERQLDELDERQRSEAEELRQAQADQLVEMQAAKAAELQAASDAYVEEFNRLKQHFGDRKLEIDQQYADERQRLNRAFSEQLADLNANLLGEQEMRRQFYAAMTADLETWLRANQAMAQSLLFGGGGLSSNPTANAAGQAASSPGHPMAMGNTPSGVNLNASFNFGAEIPAAAQNQTRQFIYSVLDDVLSRVT
jgi:hypothetical protein